MNECTCSFCEAVIPEGNSYWSFNLTNEQATGNTITVNQAHALITWCEKCESEVVCRSNITIGSTRFEFSNGRMVKSSSLKKWAIDPADDTPF